MHTHHNTDVRRYLRRLFHTLPKSDECALRLLFRKHTQSSGYRFIRKCIGVLPFRTDTYRLECLLHLGWIAMRSDIRNTTPLAVLLHLLAYRIWCFGLHHTSMSYCTHLATTFTEARNRTDRRAELFAHCIEYHYRSPLYGKIFRHVLAAKLLHDDCYDIRKDASTETIDTLNTRILQHLEEARKLADSSGLTIAPLTHEFETASKHAYRISQFQKGLLAAFFQHHTFTT